MFQMLADKHCRGHGEGLALGLVARVLRSYEKVNLVHVLCFHAASWQENMSP